MVVEVTNAILCEQGCDSVFEGWRVCHRLLQNITSILIGCRSYFFAASGASVKIYSASTGHVVSTLHPNPHSTTSEDVSSSQDSITSMALNPHNPFQLYTTSISGFLRIWDVLDGVLLRTLNLEQPIRHIAVHEKYKDEVFLALTRPRKPGTSECKFSVLYS